jgi:hypothetical protein
MELGTVGFDAPVFAHVFIIHVHNVLEEETFKHTEFKNDRKISFNRL